MRSKQRTTFFYFLFLAGMHHSRYGNSRPQECLHFAAVIKNAKREDRWLLKTSISVETTISTRFQTDFNQIFTIFFSNFEALFLRLRLLTYQPSNMECFRCLRWRVRRREQNGYLADNNCEKSKTIFQPLERQTIYDTPRNKQKVDDVREARL